MPDFCKVKIAPPPAPINTKSAFTGLEFPDFKSLTLTAHLPLDKRVTSVTS